MGLALPPPRAPILGHDEWQERSLIKITSRTTTFCQHFYVLSCKCPSKLYIHSIWLWFVCFKKRPLSKLVILWLQCWWLRSNQIFILQQSGSNKYHGDLIWSFGQSCSPIPFISQCIVCRCYVPQLPVRPISDERLWWKTSGSEGRPRSDEVQSQTHKIQLPIQIPIQIRQTTPKLRSSIKNMIYKKA